MPELKKELSLFTATFYGIGIILGAGIYVLIGEGAGIAGDALWMAFVVAAFVAASTGLSYAELAGMFPKTAAEYVFTQKAFNKEWLSFAVQWLMLFALTISSATVALGFGRYFSVLTGIPVLYSGMGLLACLSLLNWLGVKESSRFSVFSTFVEMSGLLLVIAVGAFYLNRTKAEFFTLPEAGFSGIIAATGLLFFAYIGFEELVNMAEETKDAPKVIPKALIISIAVSTVLFILVAVSAIAVIGSQRLMGSAAPLTEVVTEALPKAKLLMSIIALFATANTALAMLMVSSRMLYGLASQHAFLPALSKIGKRQTPYLAVLVVFLISMAAIMLAGLKTITLMSDLCIFAVYTFINLAVIVLRYKEPNVERTFKTPINVGNFPVLAGLGLLASAAMIFHFERVLLLYGLGILAAGLLLYWLFEPRSQGMP